MVRKDKFTWLLLLQGWAMLWVVIGHAGLRFFSEGSPFDSFAYCLSEYLFKIAYSFHMPLFIMISGYLFFLTRIRKPMPYGKMLVDKLKRLGIPYALFTFLALILKSLLSKEVNRPVSFSFGSYVEGLIDPFHGPLQEMWFIAVILWSFVIIGAGHKLFFFNTKTSIFTLLFALLLHYIPLPWPSLFALDRFSLFFVYFVIGVLLAKYSIMEVLSQKTLLLVVSLLAYFIFMLLDGDLLVVSLFGSFFFWLLSYRVDKKFPELFSSFRNYTYQIFLIGIFFQILVKVLYTKLQVDGIYFFFYLICILVGLYVPVIISKLAGKLNSRCLNLLLGLS